MAGEARSPRARRLLFLGSLILGVALLGVIARYIDLPLVLRELGRVGARGVAAFLINILLTLLGPMVGWHLLMRSVGIPVAFRTTVASSLMGFAFNLISPMSYFGGESVRTFHIGARARAPKRHVLATIVVSEFQVLAGMTLFMLGALGIAAWGSALAGTRLVWAAAGGLGLVVLLGAVLGLTLGDFRLSVRLLDLLIRCRIFPVRLAAVRASAFEMEKTVRTLFLSQRKVFFLSQLSSLLNPICHFLRPTLFFWLLGRPAAALPSLAELSVFFVLSQLIFMMPSTPGGLGVYEGGAIGAFRMLGWDAADGAAYGLLLRLDDVIFILFGFTLLFRLGLGRWLTSAPGEPEDSGSSDGPAAGPPNPQNQSMDAGQALPGERAESRTP